MNGSVTLLAEVSSSSARQIAFARVNAFSTAAGSHGCCVTNVRRTPIMCMIGKLPVLPK